MARPNRLREKLAGGRTCVGPLFQEFWSPELFEFCALAGFDFVIADGEHAGVDPQAVRNLARAAQGAGATALLRVPNGEPSLLLRYLDAGVEGLILPHCNNAADAEGLVRACRYPPHTTLPGQRYDVEPPFDDGDLAAWKTWKTVEELRAIPTRKERQPSGPLWRAGPWDVIMTGEPGRGLGRPFPGGAEWSL